MIEVSPSMSEEKGKLTDGNLRCVVVEKDKH